MSMKRDAGHPPQGALRQPDGSTVWRVWAPNSAAVSLVTLAAGNHREIEMRREESDYFVHREPAADEGLRYLYKLADGRTRPDPASRWQPEGVHGPSAVFVPESYVWSDDSWRGVAREDLVIYELHVGTFTPEGTLAAIVPRLAQLASLGITAVELMPVAQCPGDRDWGYDAVYPYAVQNSYGGPRALAQFVDAAHRAGLAVILDVIYNHLGPEGNYLADFGPYFTDGYHTPWGKAINYDGPQSDAVRQFVVDNARSWVRDFHIDGLRLDAVQTIYDFGPRHILADIQAAVKREAARTKRVVHVIAETNQNDVRLIQSRGHGGYGLDGVWSDDFHHSVHALLTGERDGYYADFGRPAHLAKALNRVFVYDGCYSPFRRRRHGSRVGAIDRSRFVICVQNHDQVGNRAKGDRLSTLVPPAAARLACGLLLLSPCVPLMFMGEEYGETRPFPFFCSFGDPALIEAVRRGRREEFAALAFRWGIEIPDPQDPNTFAAAKLSWAWPEGSPQARMRQLYQDVLTARREWPALRDRRHTTARLIQVHCAAQWGQSHFHGEEVDWRDGVDCAARIGTDPCEAALLVLQRGGDTGLLAVANLSPQQVSLAAVELGDRRLLLSTEDVRYGGDRNSLPSPFGRGAGGEGSGGEDYGQSEIIASSLSDPRPYSHSCPVGTSDNSPAVHCWAEDAPELLPTSPVGTADMGGQHFDRPSGTEGQTTPPLLPSDKSLGYCQPTLRVEMHGASTALGPSVAFGPKHVGDDELTHRPHPSPLSEGEGTCEYILPYELLVFGGSGEQP
jgi:maltooligosyltrehalose trehalohydrolase